jgi:hypothetical protein
MKLLLSIPLICLSYGSGEFSLCTEPQQFDTQLVQQAVDEYLETRLQSEVKSSASRIIYDPTHEEASGCIDTRTED